MDLKADLYRESRSIIIDDAQSFYVMQHIFSDQQLLSSIEKWAERRNEEYFSVFIDIFQFLLKGPLVCTHVRRPGFLADFELIETLRNTTIIGEYDLMNRKLQKPKIVCKRVWNLQCEEIRKLLVVVKDEPISTPVDSKQRNPPGNDF